MASVHYLPAPVHPMAHILAGYDRHSLSGFIEAAIGLLDAMDPDPDVEANGDELDGSSAEDDFWPHCQWLCEPGCPVSDPS